MENIDIGQKVKNFRLRSGLSQFDLEIEINASPGVICRLESGKVNPTKETLFNIAKALKLNATETAYLFGIVNIQEELIKQPHLNFAS